MKQPCCDSEYCHCTAEWGSFEARRRDPVDLTEYSARRASGTYGRCDACWDTVRYVAEVPRMRALSATRVVDLQPARFRLCTFHADTLIGMDPEARVYEIGEPYGTH